jgi:hypothetical protein
MKEISVLLYHNIGNYPENMMEDGLSPKTFEKQMRFLSKNGYRVVTLDRALEHLNRKIKLSPQTLAITIDGGYHDAFINVLPVLKKYNFPATFFIPPEYIGKERSIKGEPIKCMNWGEVREIMKNNMEIGFLAYGGRSIRLHYDEHAIKESIPPAIKMMRRELGSQVKYCAFKEGVPEKSLWRFLQSQGFDAVLTQCPTNRSVAVDGIGRIQIDDDDHNIFLTKISKTYLFFKDKRSWKYIRKHKLDKAGHWLSETYDQLKEKRANR